MPRRRPADARGKIRYRRQLVEKGSKMNFHGPGDVGVGDHDGLLRFSLEELICSVIADYLI